MFHEILVEAGVYMEVQFGVHIDDVERGCTRWDSVISFINFLMEMRMEIWTFLLRFFFVLNPSSSECSSDEFEDLDSCWRLF